MDLAVVWFLLIAVLWTGYLVLEGFDFGVGMLIPWLGKKEKDRRVMTNTIGPVWDGNEVWLLTAGGATFAAFPEWYATLFSGAYLALFLILLALIVRVVSFEYRGKINSDTWRCWFDRGLVIGSWVPAVLWGVAFGNIVRGMPIEPVELYTSNVDGEMVRTTLQFTGSFFDLLNPFALLGGATTAVIFLTHGAIFLAMKTTGDIQAKAAALAAKLSWVTLGVAAVWAIWLQLAYSEKAWTWAPLLVAALALLAVVRFTATRSEGKAFVASAVAIVAAVVLIFGSLFPDVLPSTVDPAYSLTVNVDHGFNNIAASSPYTLTVMTWVALALTPVVLAYQAWTYWVFRKRIGAHHIPESTGLSFSEVTRREPARG